MTCDDIRLETRGGRPLDAAMEAHLAGCAACQGEVAQATRVHDALASPTPAPLSEAIRRAAHESLLQQPRARPWWVAALLGFSIPAIAMAITATLVPSRPDWSSLEPAWPIGLTLGAGGLVFAVAALSAFKPGQRFGLVYLLTLLSVALAAVVLTGPGPAMDEGGLHPGCLGLGVLISVIPLGALLWILRSEEIDRRRAAVAGVGVGALSVALLFRHCPDTRLEHLLPFHLGAWVVLALAGGALGRWVRKPIWRPSGA